MRKRRRLANKMTMMVCAVLIAVSAFFYAPMDVEAEEISTLVNSNLVELSDNDLSQLGISAVEQGKGLTYDGYVRVTGERFNLVDSSLDLNSIYAVRLVGSVSLVSDYPTYLRNFSLLYGLSMYTHSPVLFKEYPDHGHTSSNNNVYSFDTIVYDYGYNLCNRSFIFDVRSLNSLSNVINFTVDFDIDVVSVEELTGEESVSFQDGYNAGYSAGVQVGESNGYSNGYSDGYEAGEQSGYDSGFEAGKESVDTQSYYDAGYSAGYDAGYLEGYEIGYDDGYDDGWQAYEDKISGWGADTSDYPVYITSSSSEFGFLNGYVYGNSQVYDEENIVLNFDINPNHIYRFDVKLGAPKMASIDNVLGSYTAVYFCAGGVDYFISPTFNYGEGVYKSIYVRGDMLSSSFSKKGVVTVVSSSVISPGIPAYYSFTDFWHDIQVYDVGPIGNMQNYIANQTDQLTGGYNDSQGNSVNNDFSSGLNEFETAEDSLFATATTGLKDFTFFDFESVPAMVTGMSFVGSIMGSWFSQAGGASGVGIVLSILFSIMLVAMVLGLYRWYQSKGGKD